MLALLLLACTGKPFTSPPATDDSEPVQESQPPQDTGPEGTDDDGDGWTVEEGDCDDTDIYVNPAWDEDTDDGKDNDCDGRIDEEWTGLTVLRTNVNGGGALLQVNRLGELDDELPLDAGCLLVGIDAGPEGWVGNNGYATLATVDGSGTCTDLADFSDTDYGLVAVAAHPGGYYLATTGDALYQVDADGTVTELAAWSVDTSDPATYERYVVSLAVDIRDGTVGLFDVYGGFATWSPTDGLVDQLHADLEAPSVYLYAGAARDGGGFVALGQDATTGAYGFYDFSGGAWVLRATWEDSEFIPSGGIAVDGDSQDLYAIASGGWHRQVWRVRYENGEQSILYETPDEDLDPDDLFLGVLATYTQK